MKNRRRALCMKANNVLTRKLTNKLLWFLIKYLTINSLVKKQ